MALACDPGDPEVRDGTGELQFYREPNARTPIADYYLADPYYNWSLRGSQLTSAALATPAPGKSLADLPLDADPPYAMQYRSTAPFTEQDEVLMFSVDTEAAYQALMLDFAAYATTNSLGWQTAVTPGALPGAATMVYPPVNGFPFFAFWGADLSTAAFFGTATPVGPAAAPNGSGSVKTVRIVQHGRCSQEIPYAATPTSSGVFAPLFQRYPAALGAAFAKFTKATFSFQGAFAFMHETEDREDSQWGGFFYLGKAKLANGATTRFSVPYFPILVDGRVSLEPIVDGLEFFGNPTDVATITQSLEAGIIRQPGLAYERPQNPHTAAQVVYQLFDDMQASVVSPQKCTLRPAGSSRSRTITTLSDDQCRSWFNNIVVPRFNAGLGTISPPLSTEEKQRLVDTLLFAKDRADIDGATVFRSIRCNPTTPEGQPVDATDPTTGICEMVGRAKRINTYPDGIELVWFDDDREVTAEAYPLFLAEGGFGDPATGAPHAALCAREPQSPPTTLQRRIFATTTQGSP